MASKGYRGWFITLEGGEGAGKTTLLRQLADFFNAKGFEVVQTREPGGSPLGETIRNWLLRRNETMPIGALSELLLFLSARAQHIEEVIKPALQAGKIVLCDRFNDSTIAYQGGARGLGIDYVQELCKLVCGPIVPELTFYLRVPPKVGLQRARKVHKEHAPCGELDRIESESLAFHHLIQDAFDVLAKREPGRIRVIDAEQSKDAVWREVGQVLERFYH